jgi:hypothetical protein
MVESLTVKEAGVEEFAGVVFKIVESKLWFPVSASAESVKLPWLVTVGNPKQLFVMQLRLTPETVTTAPGAIDSSPRPASIVTLRAFAPGCASITRLSLTVPIPG